MENYLDEFNENQYTKGYKDGLETGIAMTITAIVFLIALFFILKFCIYEL